MTAEGGADAVSRDGGGEGGDGGDTVEPDEGEVRARLDEVVDPCSAARGTDLGLVEMGLVEAVAVEGGEVRVDLRLTGPGCMQVPYFVEQITEQVGDLAGVTAVDVATDAGLEWTPEMMSESAQRRRRRRREALERRYEELEVGATPPEESAD